MAKISDKSRYLSLLLRHHPEMENIEVDTQGYAPVESVLKALNCEKEVLDEIVFTDNKNRYSYNTTGDKIRANQGHSLDYVKIDFEEYNSDEPLYHGTARKFINGIMSNGLQKRSRNYVHLSRDYETAVNVGMRHAKSKENLVVLKIDTYRMRKYGFKFYISDNGVVLAEEVPVKYIEIVGE